MLAKIVTGEEAEVLEYTPYSLPNAEEIGAILADKKREAQRENILDTNKEDPVKAAKHEANKILIEAQEKLKVAEAEASIFKAKKEKEIRAQLEKEFQTKLEAEVKKLKQNYIDSLEDMGMLKEVIFKKSENQLMQLVFSISRKILGDEIKTSPDVILNMLRKGFEKVKGAKEFEIRVNPVDYNTMATKKGEITEVLKNAGSVTFTSDDQVEPGGCQIVTELGEISSEPGKQLEIIMRELTGGA